MPDPLLRSLEAIVLAVHRRNGGQLASLDLGLRLLDPVLLLDSLDLAEIVVAFQKQTGASPFDSPHPPRTWAELAASIAPPAPRAGAG